MYSAGAEPADPKDKYQAWYMGIAVLVSGVLIVLVRQIAEAIRSTTCRSGSRPEGACGFERVGESVANAYRNVSRLMKSRDWRTAELACRHLNALYPNFVAGWIAASRIALALGSPAGALDAIERALRLDPGNPEILMQRAQRLAALGRRREALDAADAAEEYAGTSSVTWDAIGTLRSYLGEQHRAITAYDRALVLAPNDPLFRFYRAAVRRFIGDLEGSEVDDDRVDCAQALGL